MNLFKLKGEKLSQKDKHSWIETERDAAIEKTVKQFNREQEKFLWSTEVSFENKLVCYRLIFELDFLNVLVIVAKESSLTAWWKDFAKSSHAKSFIMVSENSALNKYGTIYSREEYKNYIVHAEEDDEKGMVAIDSVKGIMESVYFGGNKDKLKWIENTEFDLVIVDEEQGRFNRNPAQQVLHRIQRKHTLYLRNINSNRIEQEGFSEEQVFFFPQIIQQPLRKERISEGKKTFQVEQNAEKTFVSQCSVEEKQFIKEIEEFARRQIKQLKVEDKSKRYIFIDQSQIVGEVAYAWMWFIKKEGKLIFRYKINQNETNKDGYKDNQIMVNGMQLQAIKHIIEFLTRNDV